MTIKDPALRKLANRTRKLLVEMWPNAFFSHGAPKKPLKIGIGEDILRACPELGQSAVILALCDYTYGKTYCEKIVEGAERIGLDGAPCGVVSAGHAEHARERLAFFARGEQRGTPKGRTPEVGGI